MDKTIENYMALMACILNPKLSGNKALRIFGLIENNECSNRNSNYKKIKVLDTFSNEEKIFESVYEVEKYTGISKINIYIYIYRKVLGKNRYRFTYVEDDNLNEGETSNDYK